jgi:2-amino-4-hydroxy-6-hydroxymethyldihydropteridine diphosphokinase
VNAAPVIFVALGANLGDPAAMLRDALHALHAVSSAPVVASSLWASTPVDCPPGSPRFVNAVARIAGRMGQTPGSLLDALQAMERGAGRRPKAVLNEPRPLDLDLLAWDALLLDTPRLVLPHPRAHLRRFVLAPWAEIAPGFVVPGTGRTVDEHLAMLESNEALERLPET